MNAGDTDDIDEVIDYLYEEHCLDSKGRQIRHITGVGVSLGAGMLGAYAGRKGKANPLTAQVGVGCHYDKRYLDFIKSNCFGLFNYFLAYGVIFTNKENY